MPQGGQVSLQIWPTHTEDPGHCLLPEVSNESIIQGLHCPLDLCCASPVVSSCCLLFSSHISLLFSFSGSFLPDVFPGSSGPPQLLPVIGRKSLVCLLAGSYAQSLAILIFNRLLHPVPSLRFREIPGH